jgi:hypothetical protein
MNRIEERNELAKSIYAHDHDITPTAAINAADELMGEMYGIHWDETQEPTQAEPAPKPTDTANAGAEITIVDHNGEKWVRVQALGEDFIIAPHDLDGGKDHFSYDSAKEKLASMGLDTFNRKQGFIIAIYIEDINTRLKEAGADPFAADVYVSNELWHPVGSSADCYGDSTWYFNGYYGCVGDVNRCYGYFRSRPVLAYSHS